jgi:hypothetical protein
MIIKGRRFIMSGTGPNPPDPGIKIEVTFAGNPVNPVVSFAPAKYNKEVVFNYEQDDSQEGIYEVVFKHFNGGTAFDGVTSPGLKHTDGCGNQLNWKAAAACFAVNMYGVDLMDGVNSYVNYDQIYEMLQADWDVLNHQFGTPSSNISGDSDRYQQIRDLSQRVWERMLSRGMEYRIRGMVNPAADPGYTFSGFNTRIRVFSSQGGTEDMKDGYPFLNDRKLNTLQLPDVAMTREYLGENFKTDLISEWSGLINQVKAAGTKESPSLLRLFSHGPYKEADSAAGFRTFMNHVASELGDKVWAGTTTELFEYLETKKLADKKETLEGNKLTVAIDLSAVPDENRRRDMSLLISGGQIIDVAVIGADHHSYNPATGLVNVFKKKKTQFMAPVTDQEPPRFIAATYNLGSPNRITLKFNMAVSQSLKGGYTVTGGSGYLINSLTGSGDTWYLNLNKAITDGLKLEYRGQNGDVNATDPLNRLRGTSIIGYPIQIGE